MMWLLCEHHVPVWEYSRATEGEKLLTRIQYEMVAEARRLG